MESLWGRSNLVWYASYGSNLSEHRFRYYLQGGSPAGSARVYEACPDPTPPRLDLPLSLPHTLYFAGESRVWGGGVAFIDADSEGTTRSRAYLITLEQFHHVVRQENNLAALPPLPIKAAVKHGRAQLAASAERYDQLVFLGYRNSLPVLTSTSSRRLPDNRPAPFYLRQIAAGLRELGNAPGETVNYLKAKPGVAGHYSSARLRELIAAAPAPARSLA
jgi:hypothetical protein